MRLQTGSESRRKRSLPVFSMFCPSETTRTDGNDALSLCAVGRKAGVPFQCERNRFHTHTKEKMLEEFYDVVPRGGAGPGAAGPALLARTCRSIRGGGDKEPRLNVQNRTVGHTGRAVNGGVNRLEGKMSQPSGRTKRRLLGFFNRRFFWDSWRKRSGFQQAIFE